MVNLPPFVWYSSGAWNDEKNKPGTIVAYGFPSTRIMTLPSNNDPIIVSGRSVSSFNEKIENLPSISSWMSLDSITYWTERLSIIRRASATKGVTR